MIQNPETLHSFNEREGQTLSLELAAGERDRFGTPDPAWDMRCLIAQVRLQRRLLEVMRDTAGSGPYAKGVGLGIENALDVERKLVEFAAFHYPSAKGG